MRCVFAALISRYGFVNVVAFVTAMFSFPFDFFSSEPEEVTSELFGAAPFDFKARWSNPSLLVNLCIYTVCKFFFTSVAAGCPLGVGIFTPTFLIGAATGRAFGEALNALLVLTSSSFQVTADDR